MAPRGHLGNPILGESIKVHLPGESPWAECMKINDDGTWDGRIINRLWTEMSEHEKARLLKAEFGTVSPLPILHDYKQDQILTFRREIEPDYEIWVPS